MTCLVLEHSPEVRENLCILLLSFGVRPLPAPTKEAASRLLAANSNVDLAVIDVDNREAGGLPLIKELSADAKSSRIRLIAHSARADRSFLEAMNGLGVTGYLPKPYHEERTAAALRTTLRQPAFGGNEKREHIRVHPQPEELMRVSFRITADSRLYTGRVRNISMGGMAIELYNAPPENALQRGWRIPSLDFTIGARPFSPSGVIVLYTQRLLAVSFERISRHERAHLARYIFKRLNAA